MKKINELINILVDGLTKEEITLNCESMKQLLDYITTLQEENEKLKNELEQQNIDMGLYSDSDIEIKKGLIDRINRQEKEIEELKAQIDELEERISSMLRIIERIRK